MKRIISLFITLAMVLSLCPVFADYSVNAVIADVDFNGNPTYEENTAFGNLQVKYIDGAATENNMLTVADGGTFIVGSENVLSGRLAVEFKFMQTTVEDAGLFAMNADVDSYDYGPTLKLSGGNIVATKNENSSSSSLVPYAANTWYYVKLDVDIDNNNYDVYVNNAQYGNDIPFNYALDDITMPIILDNYEGSVAVNYDDVKLYVEDNGVFTYVNEDFDSYSEDYTYSNMVAGQLLAGFGLYLPSNGAYPVGGKIDSNNGYLLFGDGDSKSTMFARLPDGKEIATPITTEFIFCQTVLGSQNLDRVYQATDINEKYYGVYLSSKGGNLYAKNGGNNEFLLVNGIEANKEYHIKIYADPIKHTQTIYIDGKCVGNQLKLEEGLTSFGRMFRINNNAGTSRYYIDDYKLYTDTKETALNEAAAEINKYGGVIAEDTIALPKIASNGLAISWESSNPAVINTETGVVTRSTAADINVALTATVANGGKTTSAPYNIKVERIAQTGVTIIDSEDFSSSSASVAKGATVGKYLSSVSSNGASVSNEMIMLNKSGSAAGFANLYLQYDLEPAKYAIDFSFKADTVEHINTIYSAAGLVGTSVLNAVRIYSVGDKLYAVSGAGSNQKNVVIYNGWKADTWYDLTVYIDETAKSYDVYVNGICIAPNLAFAPEAGDTAPASVLRPFMTNSGNYNGTYYLDNIVIYTDAGMDELSVANLTSPISASSVVLPVTTENGYDIVWTTDNSNVTITDGVINAPKGNTSVVITATIDLDGRLVSKKMPAVVMGGTEPGVTIIDSDDFSTTTSVSKGSTVGSNLSSVSANGVSVENGAIKVGNRSNLYLQYDIEPTTYAVDFSFKADTVADINTIFAAAGFVGSGVLNAVWIEAIGNTINAHSSGTGSSDHKRVPLLKGWKADEEYNFTVYINETTQTYDVYINGVCRASGLKFSPEAGATAPTSVLRPFMTNSGTYAGTYYLDNIVIYTDTGMDELADFTLGNEISAANTVLKTETTNGYDVEWTTDVEGITVNNGVFNGPDVNRNIVFTATIDMDGRTVTKAINALVYGVIRATVSYDKDNDVVTAKAYKPGDLRAYETPCVMLALYKGGKLAGTKLATVTDNGDFYEASIDTSSLAAGEYTAKAFIMADASSFAPLATSAAKTITIE